MRGTDGDAKCRGNINADRRCGFRAKTVNRFEFCNLLAHGLNYPPAAKHGSHRYSTITGNRNPERDKKVIQNPGTEKKACDNTHGLLGIIAAMSKAI